MSVGASVVTISDVIELLAQAGQLARVTAPPRRSGALPVTGLASDSRRVRPGNVFACKGAAFRDSYLAAAVDAGIVAYLADMRGAAELAGIAPDVTGIIVRDIRVAMGAVAPIAWGSPADGLRIVGVTGTKGKSTVTCMLRSILDAAAGRDGATALLGSIETYDGVERLESLNTTPEAPDLWRHLANARSAGMRDVVMEVSSQGLKYHRVDGLPLEVAAFLNLGRDHISPIEHPDMEDYVASKLRIFSLAKVAVINAMTDHAERVLTAAHAACERVVTFDATPGARADVYATDVACATPGAAPRAGGAFGHGGGTSLVAHTPAWAAPVSVALPGDFNVENALAAIAIASELGISPQAVSDGLARATVPGRMEVIADAADAGVLGVVDFAHNAMALSRLLPAVRKAWPGAVVIVVCGATGDKGVGRRGEMAVEAARWADQLVFTEDDPGSEPVADICAAMVAALDGRVPADVVPDRADAVDHAVGLAFAQSRPAIVCLVGRGTESTMHRGDLLVPFPLDADLLRASLSRRA